MKYLIIFIILVFNTTLSAEIIWDNLYYFLNADQYTIEPNMIISQDSSFILIGESWLEHEPGVWEVYAIVIKISHEGELLWVNQESIDGIMDEDIRPKDIVELDDNSIISAGRLIVPEIGYLSKRDSFGNILWSSTSDLRTSRILSCDDGNILLIGSLNNNAAIRKIDIDGNVIWTCTYELGSHSSAIKDAVRISDSDCVFLGHKIDDYPDYDTFVFRTNSIGDTLWINISDGGYAHKIIKSSNNHLFMLKSNASGPNIIELDLNGNVLDEYFTDEHYFFAIDLNNELNFLATSVELYTYSISKFDYNFNIEWTIIDFPRYYNELSNNEYIFYDGSETGIHLIKTDNNLVSVEHENLISQNLYNLYCYPNPFNPATTIEFSIQNDSMIELSIFNIKGQKIKTLLKNKFTKGSHSIIWNGDDENNKPIASGIYYSKLNVNGEIEAVKKCLLLK